MIDFSAQELVPHSGDMVLLDEILACDADTLTALTHVRSNPFSQADGSMPAWIGLELMAQAIAAWAGYHARAENRPVQLGFLLGTRQFECHVDSFAPGDALTIQVQRTLQDDTGIAVFECEIRTSITLASARVNVYQPADAERYLRESPASV